MTMGIRPLLPHHPMLEAHGLPELAQAAFDRFAIEVLMLGGENQR